MLWQTADGDLIDIDTYEDVHHMRNICRFIGVETDGTLEDMRNKINDHIENDIGLDEGDLQDMTYTEHLLSLDQ